MRRRPAPPRPRAGAHRGRRSAGPGLILGGRGGGGGGWFQFWPRGQN